MRRGARKAAVNLDRAGWRRKTHIDGRPTVTERKRSKAEERSYAALLPRSRNGEGRWSSRSWRRQPRPQAEGADDAVRLRTVERDVPVRPRKVRVTAAFDEELVKWFRAMGHNYQARMNAVLRAYMLAMKSREIESREGRDWKGDEIRVPPPPLTGAGDSRTPLPQTPHTTSGTPELPERRLRPPPPRATCGGSAGDDRPVICGGVAGLA